VRFPNDTQRHAIIGKTGEGKTQAALWALEKRSYLKMPWVIIDFKGDDLIRKIPGLVQIDVRHKPPKKPGLYVVRPHSGRDDELLDDWMMDVWGNGKTGILLDEGYMIGRFNAAYRTLLTQGRSKHIPIITLSQQPTWISPFILSESEFIQSFFLHKPADIKKMTEFMQGARVDSLEKYHSYYYDVGARALLHLAPVPKLSEILARFDDKRAIRRWI
jgi:hypothetical protein